MSTTVSRPAMSHAISTGVSPGGTNDQAGRQSRHDAHLLFAAGPDLDGRGRFDTHKTDAAETPGPAATLRSSTNSGTLLDPALALAADVLDDLERVRIANANRIEVLTRQGVDKDGIARGFGLDEGHPDVIRLVQIVLALQKLEHDVELNLARLMRRHPLGPWVKATRGVGHKQAARLLAAIGDPYINSAKDAPRTVSALWAYAGLHVLPAGQTDSDAHGQHAGGDQHGDPGHPPSGDHNLPAGVAAKRRKGERANWSSRAKMRAYLIAESCVKQLSPDCRDGHRERDDPAASAVAAPNGRGGQRLRDAHITIAASACSCSPYRLVYDARRGHTATSRPDWTDGHSHNDALRVASKAVLRDLWRAARDWHAEQEAKR